ncbi:hypothetical protein I4U23_001848 [Adineta vaga]|nr:hypothetical protein I4U23_001848 [Adineta vaga]
MTSRKQFPNIIICGTSGVGKSRFCQQLCSLNSVLKHININDLAKQHKFLLEYDEENQCDILNDDAINDYFDHEYVQKSLSSGLIIDYHSAGIISDNNQIHAIFVLRCTCDKLMDRLNSRNYSKDKLEQIIQSEAFHLCLTEAREAFDEAIVHELNNVTEDDLKNNLEFILKWIDQWPFNNTMD